MKICGKCKETKSLEEFSKDNNRKDGRCFACKSCRKKHWLDNRDENLKRKREYYQENKDIHNQKVKKYRQENKEKVKKQRAGYYQKNKEMIRKQQTEYYQENKEDIKKLKLNQQLADPLSAQARILWQGLRNRSKTGIACDLELFTITHIKKWLKHQPRCECCNVEFDIGPKLDGRVHADSPSIDRFYPEKGYVEGNMYLLCWACNKAKGDADLERMRMITDWMDKTDKQIKGEKKGRTTWTFTDLHPAVLHRMRMEERQAEG